MKKVYSKSTSELLNDFVKVNNIKIGDVFTRLKIKEWFSSNYPQTKKSTVDAHIIKLTTNSHSRVHYHVSTKGKDDLFFQQNDGKLRLYDKNTDPKPIYKKGESVIIEEDINDEIVDIENGENKEFAYENDLKNYLSKNLSKVEDGLRLYENEGINGIEYDAGGRYIDILALDKNKNFVVIELKVSRGYDKVVGQILRYIGWVKNNLAEKNQSVRGVIIARKISDDLKIACSQASNIQLFEYSLSVSLQKI